MMKTEKITFMKNIRKLVVLILCISEHTKNIYV
jgi:hypothetical protein